MSRLFQRANVKTCALEIADRSFAILEDTVIELVRDGVFKPGSPPVLAEAIWAMLHGVTALLLDQVGNVQTEPEALIEAALDMLEGGLLA